MRKVILLLFLFILSCSYSQNVYFINKPPYLTIEDKNLGTIVQSLTVGSDSLLVTVNTRKVKVDSIWSDVESGIIYDSIITFGDSVWLFFDYDISTVGSYAENIYVRHSGVGGLDTGVVSYRVDPTEGLIAALEYEFTTKIDTVDFDTINVAITDWIYLKNNHSFTIQHYGVDSITSPFSIISRGQANTLTSGAIDSFKVQLSAVSNGNYFDTLYIKYDDVIGYDTLFVYLKGTINSDTTEGLIASTITATSGNGNIQLAWTDIDNAIGYYLYRKVIGETDSVKIATLTNGTYTDESVIHLLDYQYNYIAYNNTNTVISNLDTAQSVPTGIVYYVSKTGNGTDTLATIQQINNIVPGTSSNWVLFRSGDQFSDAILTAKSNIKYSTYGGSIKAIIGDSTGTTSTSYTILIDVSNVTLDNLKIYGYKDAEGIIGYSKGGINITYCEIYGGENAHDILTRAIYQTLSDQSAATNVNILHNEIAHVDAAIYLAKPYNYNIGYNKMYQLWRRNGKQDMGGAGVRFRSTLNKAKTDTYDAKYTFNIYNNEIYEFEYVAFQAGVSNTIYEYNYIHSNLDERIYRGGVKHGTVGKIFDNDSGWVGNLGAVFRYNYISNIKRYGEPGYTYDIPEEENFISGIPNVVTSDNGTDKAIYLYAGRTLPHNDYGEHFGDSPGEAPDNIISGLGYGNFWMHNNIFYNISHRMPGRSYNNYKENDVTPYEPSYSTHLINNTMFNVGISYISNDALILTESTSQSPHFIVNNIIDWNNVNARAALWLKEQDAYVSNNIYTRQSGITADSSASAGPSVGSQQAIYLQSSGQNYDVIENQYYLTDPNWVDTTTMIFASNIGINGVYIPDVRIIEDGNAYNKGMDYDLIGDTYTILGQTHELGKDPTGRSFAYDIFGNLRTTNDIGAVGIKSPATELNPKPKINLQPDNVLNASVGDTVQFTVSAVVDGILGYEWRKGIGVDGVAISNGSLYAGVYTKTLSVKNVQISNSNEHYTCIVKNMQDSTNTSWWTYSSDVLLTVKGGSTIATDTFYVATSYGDGYLYDYIDGTKGNRTLNNIYLRMGNDGTYIYNIAMLFEGITISPTVTIDSAKIYVTSSYSQTSTGTNIRTVGELSSSPTIYGDYNNIDTRMNNLTIAYIDSNNVQNWTTSKVYDFDVTSIIRELYSSYGYTNGNISIFMMNNSSTTGSKRTFDSYDNGSDYPKLVVWYTYNIEN